MNGDFMPITPFHMGPGILVKAVLRGSFSLLVFGWSQIAMDIQPLVAIITGTGPLHGLTHSYVGATFIAVFSALTGKYLFEFALSRLSMGARVGVNIRWRVAFLSAFIGAFSHIALDSIMHSDVKPFYPFSEANQLLHVVSTSALHRFCILSGLLGAALYFAVSYLLSRRAHAPDTNTPEQRAG
jgi:hypothetical protein